MPYCSNPSEHLFFIKRVSENFTFNKKELRRNRAIRHLAPANHKKAIAQTISTVVFGRTRFPPHLYTCFGEICLTLLWCCRSTEIQFYGGAWVYVFESGSFLCSPSSYRVFGHFGLAFGTWRLSVSEIQFWFPKSHFGFGV